MASGLQRLPPSLRCLGDCLGALSGLGQHRKLLRIRVLIALTLAPPHLAKPPLLLLPPAPRGVTPMAERGAGSSKGQSPPVPSSGAGFGDAEGPTDPPTPIPTGVTKVSWPQPLHSPTHGVPLVPTTRLHATKSRRHPRLFPGTTLGDIQWGDNPLLAKNSSSG